MAGRRRPVAGRCCPIDVVVGKVRVGISRDFTIFRGVWYNCLRAVPADATKALEATGGGQPRHVGDEHCMMTGGTGNNYCISLRSFLH